MTTQRDLKKIIRGRMAKTGESYATAHRHIVAAIKVGQPALESSPLQPPHEEPAWHPSIKTSKAEAKALLMRALELEPWLAHFGLGIRDEGKKQIESARRGLSVQELEDEFARGRQSMHAHLIEIAASADWIKLQIRTKTFNTRSTSYGYKRAVERWFRGRPGPYVYVANGSFIAAALGLGFPLKQAGLHSPNAYFQFSRKGIKAAEMADG